MSDPAVRRIVVGIDGSADSVIALRWACREARLRGAEVHAVHVLEEPLRSPASYAAPSPGRPRDAVAADAQMWQSVLADVAPTVRVRTETAVGLVARVLLDRCRGADMLVLGAANDVPGQMWSAGPVIRACLGRSPCPVVVISAELESARGAGTALEIAATPVPRDVPTVSGAGVGLAIRPGVAVGAGA
ncbi:MAG TPA: universal stress protein [Trebonia sp.]|jgi:nucleotide-binding universal stress UspA family protein|nr:universal stress protein [Trebonia sp.]